MLAAFALLASEGARAAEAQWKEFREPGGRYSLQYPGSWKVKHGTVESCNEQCVRMDLYDFHRDTDDYMTIEMLPHLNRRHLPIEQWYGSLAARLPQQPPTQRLQLDGREAIQVEVKPNWKEVFVPLDNGDVLTIILRTEDAATRSMFGQVLDTLRIRQ